MNAAVARAGADSHHVVLTALAILLAVLAAGAVARLLRSVVPLPLVQIALGLAIGFGTDLRIRIDAETFLLLFLPPLLFLDAWRIPKAALWKDRRAVSELAFGLVIVTVLGIGLFIHWLLPALPLAMAFALAAVLSPTDAVAVGAISRRVAMPSRLRHMIEGEALLNDASALVCLRFATAALLTGRFVWWEAGVEFVWLAVAGLAVGAVLAWVTGVVTARIAARYGEDPGAHILLTILLPFGAYLLAEAIEASGILAAVAAGLLMARVDRLTDRPDATRHRREATWDMISFALNGAVFVLLGEQLSLIVNLGDQSAAASGTGNLAMLALVTAVITSALLLLRFLYIYAALWLAVRRGSAGHDFARPPLALVAASTLAGVRGSVTLVAVLTIPRQLGDGTAIPTSAVAVTIATGAILLSLVVTSIGLPVALRRLPEEAAN